MRKERRDTAQTKRRLLAAAGEVFAQKGFWEASNADIAEKARVNTAAVSYHFGGKENLYVEAWKSALEQSMAAHPPDGRMDPEAPVSERLRARILSFMRRVADPSAHDIDLLQKETANPTGLLGGAIGKAMAPIEEGFRSIVRELLGKEAREKDVGLCQMSIMTQCFDPMLRARLAGTVLRESSGPPPFGVEELADHITGFCLSGIRGIREERERTEAFQQGTRAQRSLE